MIITSIERQQRRPKRYNIYIDEEYAFSVHEDVLIRHSLSKGMDLEREDIAELLHQEEDNKAYHSALHYLKFRSRSEKEMVQQLKRKGFSDPIISSVVEKLKEQKYINDQQFAKQWTSFRMLEQSKGRRYVQGELKEKGIDDSLIEQALSQIDDDAEKSKAMKLAEKRWQRYKNDAWPDLQRKLGQYLLRQGFTGEVVYPVLNDMRRLWEEYKN
jgi:regulatory protein